MGDKCNTEKRKTILIEVSEENIKLLDEASKMAMRSRRNFIVSSVVNSAKEILSQDNNSLEV